MHNHEPEGYHCPFCLVISGIENEKVYTKQADIIYKDDYITAFIASGWWDNNKGHVIIVSNKHFENIYDLPDEISDRINRFAKRVSLALKETYKCDGVSTRQHNEPSGGQDVWHFHLHVFPRYVGDELYMNVYNIRKTNPEERIPFAQKLREYFDKS
jgi:histidine triad (HIT) family protein